MMDKKIDWSWLPAVMPGVAAMIKEKRVAWGREHLDLCWKRGVLEGLPGWFFAREGAVAVGTPSAMCDELDAVAQAAGQHRVPLLLLHEPEAVHGAH